MLINCEICGKEFRKGKRIKNCSLECQMEAERRKSEKYNKRNNEHKTPWFKLRFKILTRDNFACRYCGRSVKEKVILQIDHIIPLSKGGTNNHNNLITACKECNLGKSDVLLEQRLITKLQN
jgi:5-methylcytosine-specific restriction endonuclease McrA